MSHPQDSTDNQRELAESLQRIGAVVALSKSGKLLRLDFRPAAASVNDAVLRTVAHSAKLNELRLNGAPITAACVDDLLTLETLSVLDIQNTVLDDAAIERLAALPHLSMLLVCGSRITPECIRTLRRRLTKVRIVG